MKNDENRSSLTKQSHIFPLSLPCCRPHGKDPHLSPELPLTADGLDLQQSWPVDWQQDLGHQTNGKGSAIVILLKNTAYIKKDVQ